ncbi:DUF5671 domain-containing protein [Arthrobacter sp. AD-310]
MNAPARNAAPAAATAQLTLRRLILYVLLFALVSITAVGLGGLLQRLFTSGAVLASTEVGGLALSLAFTLIGGPLAALLWWVVWRRLDDEAERTAPGWGLYLAAVYAVSLIQASTSLLAAAASLISPEEPFWQESLATGMAWAAVWLWHRWMWRHTAKRPINLDDVPAVIGTVFGLLVATFAAIAALGDLLDTAIRGFTSLTPGQGEWWQPVLQGLVWAAGGSVVWWWHWIREAGRAAGTALMHVAVLAAGIFAAGITALGGAAVVLFVLLRTVFVRDVPTDELLAPAGSAIASAVIGALVWRYHRVSGTSGSAAARRAGRLVTSGIALAAAAAGVGVIINATLAMAVSPLAGGGPRTLLLGGISSLAVGGPVWWRTWKPLKQRHGTETLTPGRRVYLVVFFGISAVVALIALLVIGYRLFEFVLGEVSGGSLVDRIRAPFGLLVAAALVAGYHFVLWRHERSIPTAGSPQGSGRTIEQITLVAGTAGEALPAAIAGATGASVTVWRRADAAGDAQSAAALSPVKETTPRQDGLADRVVAALAGVTARNVLVVIGAGAQGQERIDVIPLENGTLTRGRSRERAGANRPAGSVPNEA